MSSDQKRIMMCIHLFKKKGKEGRKEGKEGGRKERRKKGRNEGNNRKLASKYGLMKV